MDLLIGIFDSQVYTTLYTESYDVGAQISIYYFQLR